jgi:uroporphyrinogen decarboxylase
MSNVTHRARLEACLSGQVLDRPPVALWRHFPVDDQSPHTLAAAVLAFQSMYDFDLVKVTPASSYGLKDWGAEDDWRGNPEGTRDYTHRVIHHPDDWAALKPLDSHRGHLGAELETLRQLKHNLGEDTPLIMTIFSPLAQAKNLIGGTELLVHLRRFPDALHAGLATIMESTRRYIEAVRQTGVDGIFYAVQHAQYGLLSPQEYEQFGRAYDLPLLEASQSMWLRLVHLHGLNVMFDQIAGYPVNIINWHDRETDPSLSLGQQRFAGAVCGGVSQETLVYGTPDEIRQQALEAIQSVGEGRFILGTGCVAPVIAPYGNLMAVRQSVEGGAE